MGRKSSTARKIDTVGLFAELDKNAKKLIAEKPILARILKAVVTEVSDYTCEEIMAMIEADPRIGVVPVEPGLTNSEPAAPPEIEGKGTEKYDPNEGYITFDILTDIRIPKGDDIIKIIVNIEAQKDYSPGYDLVTRGIYYAAREISSQKEVEFTGSDYDNIKKVYSIWICFDAAKDHRNTITRYCIEKQNIYGIMPDAERYDLLSVVFLRLGGELRDYETNPIGKMLQVLFSRDIPAEQKKHTLSTEYDIPMEQAITEEVNEMCNLSEGIYESGIKQGLAQGRSEGLTQGLTQGRSEGQMEAIKLLLKTMTPSQIIDMGFNKDLVEQAQEQR